MKRPVLLSLILTLILALLVCLPAVSADRRFTGIRRVPAGQIQALFPEAKNKPLLLVFHSKYCFDCKKMMPVLKRLTPAYPQVAYRHYDLFEDKLGAGKKPIQAFKPVSVPVMIFVKKNGEIDDVLYNYQSEAAMKASLKKIL